MNATTPPLLETLALANRALDAARIRHVFIGGIAVSIWARLVSRQSISEN
jgi:hypothetical protein